MMRQRFFLYRAVPVILVGLLLFFTMTTPGMFLRQQAFYVVYVLIKPLNAFRVWTANSTLSQDMGQDARIDAKEKFAAANATIEILTQENNRLRSALKFGEEHTIDLKGALVLYYASELGKEYILIDRGERDGVQVGNFIIDANGLLIGMVKYVEQSFAKVGIASNIDEVFDVELLPLGIKTFAKGLGGRTFSLELLPQHIPIHQGDYVMARVNTSSFLLSEVVRVQTSGTGAFKEVRAVLVSHPEIKKEVFIVLNK